jgi:hypothetical protein
MNHYLNSIPKEYFKKGITFFQNDIFLAHKKVQWFLMPIIIFLIFLIIKKEFYVWVLLHLGLCFLITFWLARIHIEKRLFFFLKHFSKHIDKYLVIMNLQSQWLSKSKSIREAFSIDWSVPVKYFLKRDCIYWKTGEALISIGFFVLYSIPVFLPTILFCDKLKLFAKEGYFILYPLLLLYTTSSFFWLINFFFWNKKYKKQFFGNTSL